MGGGVSFTTGSRSRSLGRVACLPWACGTRLQGSFAKAAVLNGLTSSMGRQEYFVNDYGSANHAKAANGYVPQ